MNSQPKCPSCGRSVIASARCRMGDHQPHIIGRSRYYRALYAANRRREIDNRRRWSDAHPEVVRRCRQNANERDRKEPNRRDAKSLRLWKASVRKRFGAIPDGVLLEMLIALRQFRGRKIQSGMQRAARSSK